VSAPLVLDCRAVTVVRGDRPVVDAVDWQVRADERWVLLGPNGAGKSTLLSVVAGRAHPTSGTASVLGGRLGRIDLAELRTRVGLTGTSVSEQLPPAEPARDVVLSAAYGMAGRWRERYDEVDLQRADRLLATLGAAALAGRRFGTLSAGERKRVLIARALMPDPELLVLDEPAAELDLGGREELVHRLSALAADPDGPAIVLVTHHVEEIPPGFTHAMLLREGAVVAAGPIPEVIRGGPLSEAFGIPLRVGRFGDRYFATAAAGLR
jgi:iron complex transport system ATP-binding protein